MQRNPAVLPNAAEAFLTENHLCTFTTFRPDGSPHVAPVRFTWDADSGLARIMTVGTRRKARNVRANPDRPVAICQVDGGRWVSLEGLASVSSDPARVREGVLRYTKRYWSPPPVQPGLVVIEVAVRRVMGLF
jgi:PPOX class probable F420-dependent enzyme